MKHQGLKEYIKNVRKIQWFICAVPLGGWALQGHWKYLFPTVGNDQANFLCLTLTMLLAGVGGILPWAIKTSKADLPILLACILLLITAAAAHFYLTEKYVVSIPIPGGSLTVSIGSERTKTANDYVREECPDCTDAELVMAAGPYENEVHKLWTERSILAVRLKLFMSYASILFLLNLIVGILAKQDQLAQPALHNP